MKQKIAIAELYAEALSSATENEIIEREGGYQVIDVKSKGMKILTIGNKYVGLKYLSRHKTTKHLLKITVQSKNESVENECRPNVDSVTVTTDHICMVYDKDHFFQNTNAKNLNAGQYVSVYNETEDKEYVGTITGIEDLGTTDDWVYDCEVDDDMHAFYANNIGVHNSQFVNLQCVTEHLMKKNNQTKLLIDWPEDQKWELWNTMTEFVDTEVNKFVRDLVHNYCHTSETKPLTYELEYVCAANIYEGKKHYYIHKIFEDGDRVDKAKMTGISLKKAETPVKLKNFLKDCYDGVLYHYWKQQDYENYISKIYEEFCKLGIDDIAYWRGYSAERNTTGFLQMEIGSTIAARAANFYNQILKKLGLNKKYDEIIVGNKIRFCYVEPSNQYGIDVIGYLPGQWPKEFDQIFKVDYAVMFDKMITKQLLRYREACKFRDFDPKKQVLCDIFSL